MNDRRIAVRAPEIKYRFAALAILAAATLLYRGLDLNHLFFSPGGPRSPGFASKVQSGALTVTFVSPKDISGDPTPVSQSGLKPGDRVLSIHDSTGKGLPIRGFFDYGFVMRSIGPQDPWSLVVFRPEGEGRGKVMELRVPARRDDPNRGVRFRILVLMFYILLPYTAIVTAFFIGFMRLDNSNAFAGSLLFLSFSTIFESNLISFPPLFRDFGLFYHTTLNSALTYLFLHFFFLFPSPSWIERKMPWLRNAALTVTIVFWGAALVLTFAQFHDFSLAERISNAVPGADVVSSILLLSMFALGLASLVLNTVTADSKDERRRMVILLIGTVVGLIPLLLFLAYFWIATPAVPPWWLFALVGGTLGLFPLSFVYVVVRHRVLGIRLIVRRGLQYALVSRGFLVFEGVLIFALFYFGAGPLLMRVFPEAGPMTVALIDAVTTVVALVLLRGINRRVTPVIDRKYFRDAYDEQRILVDLAGTIRQMVTEPGRLLETVVDTIQDALHPRSAALFLRGGNVLLELEGRNSPSVHRLARFNPRGKGQLQLYRIKSGVPEPDGDEAQHLDGYVLPPDSFVVSELEKSVRTVPEALDVYLTDLKAWTAPLALVSEKEARLYGERRILERLGTRLLVPIATRDHLLGFLSLGEKMSEEPYSRKDKSLLLAVAEQTAIALDYSHLVGQVAEQEVLRRDIEIAKQVQSQLFPQAQPAFQTLDYSAVCKPAREVGGDYYDFLQLGAKQLCLAVGDISGKGLSASLLMASLQALLRSQAPARGQNPALLLSDINRLMCSSTDGSKYATFFCGIYDELGRTLTYVNAGHNLPILVRGALNGGGTRPSVEKLTTGGTVVGLFPEAAYEQECLQLSPGDLLAIYTDGVTEAFNAEMEEFGEERLIHAIKQAACLPAREICQEVLRRVDAFVGTAPRHDDLTLLVTKVVG